LHLSFICGRCKNANSRLTFKGWKSPVANAENPSSRKNQAQPKKQNSPKLRETRASAAEAWAKLGVNVQEKTAPFSSLTLSASVVYLSLPRNSKTDTP